MARIHNVNGGLNLARGKFSPWAKNKRTHRYNEKGQISFAPSIWSYIYNNLDNFVTNLLV